MSVRAPLIVLIAALPHERLTTVHAATGGWFHTGDQGFLDEEGYLTLTGRIKELINRGGEKISPLEVSSAPNQIYVPSEQAHDQGGNVLGPASPRSVHMHQHIGKLCFCIISGGIRSHTQGVFPCLSLLDSRHSCTNLDK